MYLFGYGTCGRSIASLLPTHFVLHEGGSIIVSSDPFLRDRKGLGSIAASHQIKIETLCPPLVGYLYFVQYFGHYSYGHQGGQWTNNKVHDNIGYGFDPHDDSDHLLIEGNEVGGHFPRHDM